MKTYLILTTLVLAGLAGSANAATCAAGGRAKAGIHHGIGLHLGHGAGAGGGMGCSAAKSAATAHAHKAR